MTLYKKRGKFNGLSRGIGSTLGKLPISANQWTIFSLLPVLFSAYFLSQQQFLLAAIFFLISSAIDLIDGSVARFKGTSSKFGAYLDTITDRFVEGIICFGLLFASLPNFFLPAFAWIFLFFFGSIMTTYAKAAAKEKELVKQGQELKGGLLERAERLIILVIGMLLAMINPLYLTLIIAVLAVLSIISALQRIMLAKGLATKN
jgi:archaetidylinositol phosphate synthase